MTFVIPWLIELAQTASGASEAEIARQLGVDPPRLWQWKTGMRPMPSAKIAALAQMAQTDVVRALGAYQAEQIVQRREKRLLGGGHRKPR